MLICHFCNENDFDELGLDIHLANYCMGDQSPKLNSLAYRNATKRRRIMNTYRVTFNDGTVRDYWGDSAGEVRHFHSHEFGGIASVVTIQIVSPYNN